VGVADGKWHIKSHYPTQAKGRLEWGTQHWLPVWQKLRWAAHRSQAGAQAVLMSLWSLPDKETLELVKRFYTKWLAGMEIRQALKEAQLEMREQVRMTHDGKDLPYYWGAFVLVGR
jgi:hypothetical protein